VLYPEETKDGRQGKGHDRVGPVLKTVHDGKEVKLMVMRGDGTMNLNGGEDG
jgi:hypothetical protein